MSSDPSRRFSLLASLAGDDLRHANELGMATNRTVILALRDDLETALARGYKLKPLHTRLVSEGVLSSDYSSFRRAVRTLGLGESDHPVAARSAPPLPSPAPPAMTVADRTEGEITASFNERRTFTWNPDPDPKDFKPVPDNVPDA